jgi:hypothetical protein
VTDEHDVMVMVMVMVMAMTTLMWIEQSRPATSHPDSAALYLQAMAQ